MVHFLEHLNLPETATDEGILAQLAKLEETEYDSDFSHEQLCSIDALADSFYNDDDFYYQ